MRRKLKQISNLSAHGRRKWRTERKVRRQRGADSGVSYEQKGDQLEGEEVEDDDDDDDDDDEDDDDDDDDDDDGDGNVRSWVVFELRAPVVQTRNGSRRMAGMT